MRKTRTALCAAGVAVIAAVGLTVDVGVAAADAPGRGSVSGHVWFDRNADKVFGAGDRAAWGSQVRLLDAEGAVVGSADVGANGTFLIEEVVPGVYQVDGVQAGLANTTRSRVTVRVRAGGTAMADFGIRGGRVTGTVWHDVNEDGIRQRGETGDAGEGTTAIRVGTDFTGHVTQNADGTYAIDDLPAGPHTFHATDSAPVTPLFTNSPQHRGDNPRRDSDFSRTGRGPTVEFRVSGNRVVPADGRSLVLDAGYHRGVNHGTITLTADRDTTTLHVGDTLTLTTTATYTGNAYDDHGARILLPDALTPTTVNPGPWIIDDAAGHGIVVRDPAYGSTAPNQQATIRITATVTAPIPSSAITAELVYSSFLTPSDSNYAFLPILAS